MTCILSASRHVCSHHDGTEGPNKTKAKIFKLTEVTGWTITYATVQVCVYKLLI